MLVDKLACHGLGFLLALHRIQCLRQALHALDIRVDVTPKGAALRMPCRRHDVFRRQPGIDHFRRRTVAQIVKGQARDAGLFAGGSPALSSTINSSSQRVGGRRAPPYRLHP